MDSAAAKIRTDLFLFFHMPDTPQRRIPALRLKIADNKPIRAF